MRVDGVEVLLLCAVPVEWDSLKTLVSDPVEDPVLNDPAIRGRLEFEGRSLSVALVEVGVGSTKSGMSTLSAIEKYQPRLVLFIGVAGGIKDVAIGDVVVADKVYYYESGKLVDGAFQARSDTRTVPATLAGIARRIRAQPNLASFQIFVGALASGEKVIADVKSDELARIHAHSGDALALEMEGNAVLAAIDRAEITPDFFIVRGVSDLIAAKSESDAGGSQKEATENARTVALRLIAAWDSKLGLSVPLAQASGDVLAAGLPLPGASECFVLVAPVGSPRAEAAIMGGLPFAMVVDLDPATDADGLLSKVRAEIVARQPVHLGSPTNPPPLGRSATAWLSVRGFDSAAELTTEWTRTLRKPWRALLGNFSATFGGRRITVLIADDAGSEWSPWLSAIVDDLLTEFGERAYIGTLGAGRALEPDFRIALSPSGLMDALSPLSPALESPSQRIVPGPEGSVEISREDAAWIAEDGTIYWAADPDTSTADADALDFLRGGELTPAALARDADVTRTETASLQRQLLGMLGKRRTVRQNLFHAPGAGGTTVARRLGFNIRTRFPVVFLHRFREGETAKRIDAVVRQSKNAVLVVCDSPHLREDQIAALTNDLHALSVPAVVLAVSRRYSPPSTQSSSPYLPEVLADNEAAAFVDAYAARAYTAKRNLEAIASYSDHRRNAFYFGLVAFEEEFHGLESFVSGRLIGIEGVQREAILVCSFAHFFGQSAVPEYALARLVGLPPSRAGGFARTLAPELRGLLWRSSDGEWRTTHALIAEEVLRQLGGGDDVQWKHALARWGMTFADFCLAGGEDDAMQQLIESVFTDRGDGAGASGGDSARETFARLIERIPSRDGAAELLTYVANRRPNDAHLWAHTARYFAFRLNNFVKAEHFARHASSLAPDNATLHHILGMVHRARVYDGIGRRIPLDELAPWVNDSAEEFSVSREKGSGSKDYGFVSEIQMRIRVVEYGTRGATLAKYLASAPHPLVVACVEKAEDLISTLRYRGDPRQQSGFEQTERAKLNRLYGDYERSLQLLDGMLTKGPVPPPIVRRQIVWTYLARAGRDWRSLTPREVVRVISLLDENLTQAGYASADALAWWRAVRLKNPAVSHERVKEILAYWRASNPCLDAEYCSAVAYALDVLEDLPSSLPDAVKHARRSADIARNEGTRTRSLDWYGDGDGIASLVHHSELGQWDPALDFWADTTRLRTVQARVSQIRGPQAGTADVKGMPAFFVPQRAGVIKGRHDNERIEGYLAFTHDGLRLWEPRLLDQGS